MLARAEFENAVKEALRYYTQVDLLAENALLRSRLLTSSKPGAATPQALRALLAETAKTSSASAAAPICGHHRGPQLVVMRSP